MEICRVARRLDSSNIRMPSGDPRPVRAAEDLQDLAGRGRDAHAHEQPRSGGGGKTR